MVAADGGAPGKSALSVAALALKLAEAWPVDMLRGPGRERTGRDPEHKGGSKRTGQVQMLTPRPHDTQAGGTEDRNEHCLTEEGTPEHDFQ